MGSRVIGRALAVASGLLLSAVMAWSQPAAEERPVPPDSVAAEAAGAEASAGASLRALGSIEAAIRDATPGGTERERRLAQEREQRNLTAQKKIARWTKWSAVISLVATFLLFSTLYVTNRTNKLISAQFAADNPPRLEIKQIYLDVESFSKNKEPRANRGISGELWVFNSGSSEAKIHASSICVHIGTQPPVSRPFENESEAGALLNLRCDKEVRFPSGHGFLKEFVAHGCRGQDIDLESAMDEASEMTLYLIGRIVFSNSLSKKSDWNAHMLFCRKYDLKSKRFVPTDDFDYEYHT